MILIDRPYISDFLLNTIKENKVQIVSTIVAREMIKDNSLNWVPEEEAIEKFDKEENTLLISNSENSISWIEKNLSFTEYPKHIQNFKNKIKFRELLKESFPNYFFKGIKYEDLKTLNISNFKFPFIIKPAVGFFSLAVHKVNCAEEWLPILNKIKHQISKLKGMYPKEVVDISDFIIEEYITGKEFAVDCYFDNDGNPVILNILHHVFSSSDDVSDRVYSSSKTIFEQYSSIIFDFLKIISKTSHLKNFPAHIEVRINEAGEINPIEVNPLRFGGWCTTGDLPGYAYGFNSYEYFLKGKKPDWDRIFDSKEEKKYSIIVLDNNSGIDEHEIGSFDYDLLLKDFKKPLSLRKVDYKKYTIFGFLFIETTKGNEKELKNILKSNLTKYIKLKGTE